MTLFESDQNSNTVPVIALSTYLALVSICFSLILQTLRRAYRALPIAQRTRSHGLERRNEVFVFATLAGLSFVVSSYHLLDAIVGSYGHWAHQKRHSILGSLWSYSTWLPQPENHSGLQLGQWLKEEGWLRWGVSRMFGSRRDFWWVQQLSMATGIWSVFLAIEGRRRNIHHSWAFLLLGQLTSLSVAQNLFNIALLLTPRPMPDATESIEVPAALRSRSAVRKATKAVQQAQSSLSSIYYKFFPRPESKPSTWTPHPLVYILPILQICGCTALLPQTIGSPFLQVVLGTINFLSYVPLVLSHTNLLPARFGRTHSTIHHAHQSSHSVFSTCSLIAFVLHVTSTATALLANAPQPNADRHFYDHLWSSTPALTTSARLRRSAVKVLGALADHPLVSKIGWDVLFSGLTLFVWAGVRGLNVSDMLRTCGMPGTGGPHEVLGAAKKQVTFLSSNNDDNTDDGDKEPKMWRPLQSYVEPESSATPARRGRPRKNGAEEPVNDNADAARRRMGLKADREAATTEHEEEHGAVDVVEGTESAALAWGMMLLGGLGMAAGSVLGAEAISR